MKNLTVGDRLIYITRISGRLHGELGLASGQGHLYFAVAALRVIKVWSTHEQAALRFTPGPYVASPTLTPYPPNLAFEPHPVAAAARECSVIHDEHDKWHLPEDATDRMWTRQYLAYRTRQARGGLRAAECVIDNEDGLACLQLDPAQAPAITPDWWGGAQMNVMGDRISEGLARPIRQAIAHSAAP